MREEQTSLPQLPMRLSVLEVLGLKDHPLGDPDRLRALQFGGLPEVTILRSLACTVAALLTAIIFAQVVPPLLLGVWVIALIVASIYGIRERTGWNGGFSIWSAPTVPLSSATIPPPCKKNSRLFSAMAGRISSRQVSGLGRPNWARS